MRPGADLAPPAGPRRAGTDRITPRRTWVVAVVLAAVAALLVPPEVAPAVRAAVAWDAATLALLGLPWWIILRADPAATRRRAGAVAPGRLLLLLSAVGTSVVALVLAVALFRVPRGELPLAEGLHVALGVWAVTSAWALLHTAYALHYAHLYYREGDPAAPAASDAPTDKDAAGGLEFPGGPPAELDFAYFAFTIGMTFQTSDVTIASGAMRRAVLGHATLTFGFNTVILALAVSLLGALAN